jgi:tRNA (guanine-N7-)-methyltransferase
MGKKKRERFAEMETFANVLQPSFNEVFGKDYTLKGNWKAGFFHNANPVVLELGCGKGEYTTGLARLFPGKNFIGIDIKGSRMWKGARRAIQDNLSNAAFLRTRIELIHSFFGRDEIDEIWLTFPDPQIRKKRKRLTSARFLNSYRAFLKDGGIVHLKTDNKVLHLYTLALVSKNGLKVIFNTEDLYGTEGMDDLPFIKTYYEEQYLKHGIKIRYLCFALQNAKEIEELKEEDQ